MMAPSVVGPVTYVHLDRAGMPDARPSENYVQLNAVVSVRSHGDGIELANAFYRFLKTYGVALPATGQAPDYPYVVDALDLDGELPSVIIADANPGPS